MNKKIRNVSKNHPDVNQSSWSSLDCVLKSFFSHELFFRSEKKTKSNKFVLYECVYANNRLKFISSLNFFATWWLIWIFASIIQSKEKKENRFWLKTTFTHTHLQQMFNYFLDNFFLSREKSNSRIQTIIIIFWLQKNVSIMINDYRSIDWFIDFNR